MNRQQRRAAAREHRKSEKSALKTNQALIGTTGLDVFGHQVLAVVPAEHAEDMFNDLCERMPGHEFEVSFGLNGDSVAQITGHHERALHLSEDAALDASRVLLKRARALGIIITLPFVLAHMEQEALRWDED
ncbi:hypothetical protein [Deinococcus sp. UR1]|uniref:hypothetical protein n=1 Tax=Deinococcus sp. UR1 TaxID=1704277 RepID=UPI000C190A19|nr:hypothetical protein [Deinococcus sp. UR1]PIG96861.1 hypothetical protein AMD26_015130 [Deinococcus sp. UR1]